MENPQTKKFPWLIVIIIVIVVLALVQFLQTSSGDEETNKDTKTDTATSTEIVIPPVTQEQNQAPATTTNSSLKNGMHTITLETNKGTIVFETYDADAPKTSENFVKLTEKGYYNGIIFHRVIKGFMIQGGDPTGTGMGGAGFDGKKFADELNPATDSYKKGYVRGTVAMANSGPNTNGSQFFIMHQDYPLPNNYTIFGHVVKGIEIVDAIANMQTASERPVTDIVIKKATVATK